MDPESNYIENGVFTVVSNHPKYLNFAFALARSYRLHNQNNIPFFILADYDFSLPADLKWVRKKIVGPEIIGKGVEIKLSFDKVAPAARSLFIDADSLIYRDISYLFSLHHDAINVIGTKITGGTWDDMEAKEILKKFEIPYLVRYCGACYLIVASEKTNAVFNKVRALSQSGHAFQKHTHSINEEPVFGIALAANGIEPIIDDGNIWGDVHQLKSHKDLNVLSGFSRFNNIKNDSDYKFWLPEGAYSPAIIHFGGGNYNKNPWLFDAARLKIYHKFHLGKSASDLITILFVKTPYFILKRMKSMLGK